MGRKRTQLSLTPAQRAKLAQRLQMVTEARAKDRMRFALLAAEGQHTLEDLAVRLGRARSTLQLWWINSPPVGWPDYWNEKARPAGSVRWAGKLCRRSSKRESTPGAGVRQRRLPSGCRPRMASRGRANPSTTGLNAMAGRRRESGKQALAEPESQGRPYHTAIVHHNVSAPVISDGHPLAVFMQ